MAFIPFPVGGGQPRQQMPNYTPQLVQQGVSDLLGAVLGYMNLQENKATGAAARELDTKRFQAEYGLDGQGGFADRRLKLEEGNAEETRKTGELNRSLIELQKTAAQRGMDSENVQRVVNWGQQFGGSIKASQATTTDSLVKAFGPAFASGRKQTDPLKTSAYALLNRLDQGITSGEGAANDITSVFGGYLNQLSNLPDPAMRAAAAEEALLQITPFMAYGKDDRVKAAANDLYKTYERFLQQSPAAFQNQAQSVVDSYYGLHGQTAQAKAMEIAAKVSAKEISPEQAIPMVGALFNTSPLSTNDVLQRMHIASSSPTPVAPTAVPGMTRSMWNSGINALMDIPASFQMNTPGMVNIGQIEPQQFNPAPAIPTSNGVPPYQPSLSGGMNGDFETFLRDQLSPMQR